jgi:hypothetical protein
MDGNRDAGDGIASKASLADGSRRTASPADVLAWRQANRNLLRKFELGRLRKARPTREN